MNNLLEILICPVCDSAESESGLLALNEQALRCPRCETIYPAIGFQAFRILKKDVGQTKKVLASFWGDLYRQFYSKTESLSKIELRHQLELMQDFFQQQHHLAVTEVDLGNLAGKVILEIGSGSGAHSALFRAHGAKMVSIDLTPSGWFPRNVCSAVLVKMPTAIFVCTPMQKTFRCEAIRWIWCIQTVCYIILRKPKSA